MQNKKPSFSFQEFRNWFSQQEDMKSFFDITNDQEKEQANLQEVVSGVSMKKLSQRIFDESCDKNTLLAEFYHEGGHIVSQNGKNYLIKTYSGTFQLPRFCVELRD